MVRQCCATAGHPSGYSITALILCGIASVSAICPVDAVELETTRVNARNGWKAFPVISVGDNPQDDGFNWTMPGTFDGLGAGLPNASTLRLQVNHETNDAAISEVNLDLTNFQDAISEVINHGSTSGVTFVSSARQAYDRWSKNGGSTWTMTTDTSNTSFYRFCSGQSYSANTFGAERGFADVIYITGEEGRTNRLFALDPTKRDLYQLSGVTGSAAGGIGGMPFDSLENTALLDTQETDHVALLLSPDGGTQNMQMYVGEKGKDAAGNASTDFLARNGLAYGSYYFLNDTLPDSGISTDGSFDTTDLGALDSTKFEDIDASPNNPTRVVLGDQDSGLFTFDFLLDFSSGSFNSAGSSFSIAKIKDHSNDTDGVFGDADNVDWTDATLLDGVSYPDGLIFVNEDSGTAGGEIWMIEPNGSGLTAIADTIGISGSTETSGILDISSLVGYTPGSILLTSNQGSNASLSTLINPHATLLPLPGDFDGNGVVDMADIDEWTAAVITGRSDPRLDLNEDQRVDQEDRRIWVEEIKRTYFGDSNLDGEFNTADLVFVFQAGEYEDGPTHNSSWARGDWDGDGEFTSGDLIVAFQDGGYEQGPRNAVATVPEPASFLILMTGLIGIATVLRTRQSRI